MSEHDRDLAQMEQDQAARHREAQALIQQAIAEVTPPGRDLPAADVIELLAAALDARGIGPQPRNWLESVADEISSGGTYVEDPAAAPERVMPVKPDADPV
jgi:hypothetical protein